MALHICRIKTKPFDVAFQFLSNLIMTWLTSPATIFLTLYPSPTPNVPTLYSWFSATRLGHIVYHSPYVLPEWWVIFAKPKHFILYICQIVHLVKWVLQYSIEDYVLESRRP